MATAEGFRSDVERIRAALANYMGERGRVAASSLAVLFAGATLAAEANPTVASPVESRTAVPSQDRGTLHPDAWVQKKIHTLGPDALSFAQDATHALDSEHRSAVVKGVSHTNLHVARHIGELNSALIEMAEGKDTETVAVGPIADFDVMTYGNGTEPAGSWDNVRLDLEHTARDPKAIVTHPALRKTFTFVENGQLVTVKVYRFFQCNNIGVVETVHKLEVIRIPAPKPSATASASPTPTPTPTPAPAKKICAPDVRVARSQAGVEHYEYFYGKNGKRYDNVDIPVLTEPVPSNVPLWNETRDSATPIVDAAVLQQIVPYALTHQVNGEPYFKNGRPILVRLIETNFENCTMEFLIECVDQFGNISYTPYGEPVKGKGLEYYNQGENHKLLHPRNPQLIDLNVQFYTPPSAAASQSSASPTPSPRLPY